MRTKNRNFIILLKQKFSFTKNYLFGKNGINNILLKRLQKKLDKTGDILSGKQGKKISSEKEPG